MNPMNLTEELIKFHEGYASKVYRDTEGNLTCGYGHLLYQGSPVSKIIAEEFFRADMEAAYHIYSSLYLDNLDPVRRAAMINLCFNMGNRIRKHTEMLKALRKQDWLKAAYELKYNSIWWYQVGRRGPDIWGMLMTGNWPTIPK